ncbi:MAG: hypothetical protein HY706_10640 [Candidatus Hydrogenedentes bacterium]|nr:hypothetical protein [Candidatus Hydrogenedentota bacterium]
MSSILDALKKLEDDKADAVRPEDLELDREVAERDLTGYTAAARRTTDKVTPLAAAVVASLITAALLLIAVLGILAMRRGESQTADTPQVSLPTGATSTSTPAMAARTVTKEIPLDVTTLNAERASVPMTKSSTTETKEVGTHQEFPASDAPAAPSPVTTTGFEPAATPPANPRTTPEAPPTRMAEANPDRTVVARAPTINSTDNPQSTVRSPQSRDAMEAPKSPSEDRTSSLTDGPLPGHSGRRSPTPAFPAAPGLPERTEQNSSPKAAARNVDLHALPELADPDRVRLGLEGLQLNMPRMRNQYRPYDSAIINFRTVRVGQTIPGTSAILIAVDLTGIGIEIETTGEQFYLPPGR